MMHVVRANDYGFHQQSRGFMSWITVIWSMIAAACITLAGVYLSISYRARPAWTSLLFAITAIATAAYVFCELRMIGAQTPEAFGAALSWAQVATWLVVVSLVGFVLVCLGAGRPWLAWSVIGLRTLALPLNFLTGENLNFRAITSLQHARFLGESISIPVGEHNPWMLIGQLSLLLLVVFVVDASAIVWRRGDRERSLRLGASTALFVIAAAGQSILVFWGVVRTPLLVAPFYLGVVIVMAAELSREVVRASLLTKALKESEALMSLAIESANLGIWVRDIAKDQIQATPRWCELFGFNPTQAMNLESLMGRMHVDDRDVARLAMTRAASGKGYYEVEFRLMLADGAIRWISAQGRVEFDGNGRPLLTRGVCSDITARKHSEQEMLRLRQEIAHVGRVSVMGQLASTLAHEINQPLGAILRNTEAASIFLQAPSPDLEEIRAIVNDIRADDQRAGAIIDRMRGLLKRRGIDLQPLDLADLIGDVEALMRPEATARHVKLVVDIASGIPPVRGDRVQVQQVLLNLISNAMDAADAPGEATRRPRRIAVSAMRDGEQTVEVVVSDSGPGIPADRLEQVFDSFFTTKATGMGMGLSISRSIIEAHGGRMWAESHDSGASLRFTLPAAVATASS
jgi:PAS domain S-box-containing protein